MQNSTKIRLSNYQHTINISSDKESQTDQSIGVFVKCDRCRRLEELAIQGREDPDVVVRPRRGAHDAGVLIDGFQELACGWRSQCLSQRKFKSNQF